MWNAIVVLTFWSFLFSVQLCGDRCILRLSPWICQGPFWQAFLYACPPHWLAVMLKPRTSGLQRLTFGEDLPCPLLRRCIKKNSRHQIIKAQRSCVVRAIDKMARTYRHITRLTTAWSTMPLSWKPLLMAYIIALPLRQTRTSFSQSMRFHITSYSNPQWLISYLLTLRTFQLEFPTVLRSGYPGVYWILLNPLYSLTTSSSRNRGPRYWSSNPSMMPYLGLCPRRGILCHVSNIPPCPSAHDRI